MASPDIESPWLCAAGESFCGSFNIRVEEENAADILHVLEVPTSSVPYNCSIPKPPPLPIKPCTKNKYPNRFLHCSFVPKETKDVWDKLFKEGNGADVYIITKDESCIQAHSSILLSKAKNGFRYIKIPGMLMKLSMHSFVFSIPPAHFSDPAFGIGLYAQARLDLSWLLHLTLRSLPTQ
ncbi:hypothetical protein AB3S75_027126 [Citrus x aurantiifolia]